MFLTAFIQRLNDIKKSFIDVNGNGAPDCQAERFTTYGLLSKPPAKTKVVCLEKNQKLIIVCEQNSFPNIEAQISDGDVAVTDGTQKIHIKKSGGIEIEGTKITISGGTVSIGGTGTQALITQSFLTAFNTHTHGSPSGATTPPTIPAQASLVATKVLKAT